MAHVKCVWLPLTQQGDPSSPCVCVCVASLYNPPCSTLPHALVAPTPHDSVPGKVLLSAEIMAPPQTEV